MTAMFEITTINKNGKEGVSVSGQLYSEHWDWAMNLINSSKELIQIKFRFFDL